MAELKGRCTVPGVVEGELVVSRQQISFLGDIDPKTGLIVATNHPLKGQSIKGKIFAFPSGKGSTVGSYVIFQMKKNGTAPLAIINKDAEAIIAVGAIISDIPMVTGIDVDKLESGSRVKLDCAKGLVRV